MSKFKIVFDNALARFIEKNTLETVKEIIDYEEDTYNDGFCSTCSYERTDVDITYKNATGVTSTYSYRGNFSDLINELTEE